MSGREGRGNASYMKFNAQRTAAYRKQGYWGDATLLDCWNMSVLRHPEKTAVIDSYGAAMTYREVDAAAGRIAHFLRNSGVCPGDVVSLQLPGWCEFVPVYIACLKSECVVNPVPPNLRFEEVRHILGLCEARAFFAPYCYRKFLYEDMVAKLRRDLPTLFPVIVDKFHEPATLPALSRILADNPPPRRPDPALPRPERRTCADDLAAVLFTSGSEGVPKGVMLTHNNIIFSEMSFAAHLNIHQFDTVLMPAPVTHATGFHHGVTMPFLIGATAVLQDVFVPQVTLACLEKYRCTVASATPAFVYDILRELDGCACDISSLRFFLSGGAPLSPELAAAARAKGITIYDIYGSTESVPHAGPGLPDGSGNRTPIGGVPMPGVEVRVVGASHAPLPPGREGEEASRGPQVFMGYLGQRQLTDAALDDLGWYYSGDLCVMGQDGAIRITDRLKDVLNRGGENISSLEVERILLRHPNIREAAVVGMPDPRLGEKICAYVVLVDPCAGLGFAQLCEFLRGQEIMKQKYPERLEIVEGLPRTASGKVKKSLLRRDIARKLAWESQNPG